MDLEEHGGGQQDHQSRHIGQRKHCQESACLSTGPAEIQLQGNQAGKGGDGRTQTADVDALQQGGATAP